MSGQLTQYGRQLMENHPRRRQGADHAPSSPRIDERFAREADYSHRRDLFDPETDLERRERHARELVRRLLDLTDARIWAAGWRSTRRRQWLPRPASVPASASQP